MTASAARAASPPGASRFPERSRRTSAAAAAAKIQTSAASPSGPVSTNVEKGWLCAQVRMGKDGSTRS